MTEIKYTKDHEIIALNDNVVTIGITEYAKDALGDLVFIELPEVGLKVESGDEFAVVESVKIASEIYTPVKGEVIEINSDLEDDLDKLKESIDQGGWIAKIKIDGDTSGLMNQVEYDDYVKGLN